MPWGIRRLFDCALMGRMRRKAGKIVCERGTMDAAHAVSFAHGAMGQFPINELIGS
jgi:hypothetical protein